MDPDPATPGKGSPLRDVRLRVLQRTVLAALVLAALAPATAAVFHWLDPAGRAIDRVMSVVLALALAVLAWRQWRRPARLVSTLWMAWTSGIVGVAVPAWYFVLLAMRTGVPLVDMLPPISTVLLPVLIGMALFAKPRHALIATLSAWAVIAAPILWYLAGHPAELKTPRGLDLLLAFGPVALFIPLVVPLLRSVEQRFRALQAEGERLQALAERDVLLGLYNRRAGERFLGTLLAHARDDAALVLFDIDHFKHINDTHGHAVGDAVLVEVGRRCSAQLDRHAIFARWGGEEFLVVLPGVPPEHGHAVAERLRAAIVATPIRPAGLVSASFGVTPIRAGDTLPEVLQRADEALYRAKAGGRNRVEAG
jgi:diguanylate cyclase (GGDEF)-like protein